MIEHEKLEELLGCLVTVVKTSPDGKGCLPPFPPGAANVQKLLPPPEPRK